MSIGPLYEKLRSAPRETTPPDNCKKLNSKFLKYLEEANKKPATGRFSQRSLEEILDRQEAKAEEEASEA